MSLRQDILAIGHALGLDKKDHSAANEREIADEIADMAREIICNTMHAMHSMHMHSMHMRSMRMRSMHTRNMNLV